MVEKKMDFKSMSKKQKLDYFWDYYRYHLFGGILVLIFIGTVVYELSTKATVLLNVTICDYVDETSDFTSLETALTNIVKPDANEKEVVKVQVYPFVNMESSQTDLASVYLEKFMAQVVSGELDVFILNESDFNYFNEQGFFENLTMIEGLSLDAYRNDQLVADEAGNVYGIKLENENLLGDNITSRDKVLTVMKGSQRPQEAIELIQHLGRVD